MKAWAESLRDIQATGANLVAVHPEPVSTAKRLHIESSLNFPLLADLDQSVIKAYDIQFRVHKDYEEMGKSRGFLVSEQNADSSWHLPIPATYLVRSDGIIATAWVDHDYWNRTEADAVLAAISEL